MVVSTYQAASGGGAPAMAELYDQTKEFLDGKSDDELTVSAFQHRIAFNCIPHIDKFLEDDSTKEEWKMVVETKKIMGDQDIRVAATCVRVPCYVAMPRPFTWSSRTRWASRPRARRSRRSRASWSWTTAPRTRIPCRSAGRHERDVRRSLRRDDTVDHGLAMWVVADQIRKGAALNAVQIAQLLLP